jgi:hypothetical protein
MCVSSFELGRGVRCRDVFLIQIEQSGEIAGSRGLAAFLRRAELLQMQIGDSGFIEPRGQLSFGKSRTARGRDRAGVDHKADAGALELVYDRGGAGLFVADGEEGHERDMGLQAGRGNVEASAKAKAGTRGPKKSGP